MGIEDLDEDLFLRIEIVIERAARGFARIRKVEDRGVGISLGREQLRRRIQDALPDLGVVLGLRSRHRPLRAPSLNPAIPAESDALCDRRRDRLKGAAAANSSPLRLRRA